MLLFQVVRFIGFEALENLVDFARGKQQFVQQRSVHVYPLCLVRQNFSQFQEQFGYDIIALVDLLEFLHNSLLEFVRGDERGVIVSDQLVQKVEFLTDEVQFNQSVFSWLGLVENLHLFAQHYYRSRFEVSYFINVISLSNDISLDLFLYFWGPLLNLQRIRTRNEQAPS